MTSKKLTDRELHALASDAATDVIEAELQHATHWASVAYHEQRVFERFLAHPHAALPTYDRSTRIYEALEQLPIAPTRYITVKEAEDDEQAGQPFPVSGDLQHGTANE